MLSYERPFPADPERLFALLHTPSAIIAWWGASQAVVMPRQGGLWAATWGPLDTPLFVTAAHLEVFDPPRRLVFGNYEYFASVGPLPFEANFRTEFTITPGDSGQSRMRVVQQGFPNDPAADAYYDACAEGWRVTFDEIARYVQTKT